MATKGKRYIYETTARGFDAKVYVQDKDSYGVDLFQGGELVGEWEMPRLSRSHDAEWIAAICDQAALQQSNKP